MAASAWVIPGRAKRNLGLGNFTLATGVFRMSLHRTSASAALHGSRTVGGISSWAQVPAEISATGGYVAGGKSIVGGTLWSTGATTNTLKFYYTTGGLVFTGSGGALTNIRYAVIKNSVAGAGNGRIVCWAALSTAAFTIASGNTLTVLPAATGVFTMV